MRLVRTDPNSAVRNNSGIEKQGSMRKCNKRHGGMKKYASCRQHRNYM
jgi:hypothetical protein